MKSFPELKISATPDFEAKVNHLAATGKPYTIKLEITDLEDDTYAAEFDMLEGGFNAEAMRKGMVTCFALCDSMPVSVLLRDACLMATA